MHACRPRLIILASIVLSAISAVGCASRPPVVTPPPKYEPTPEKLQQDRTLLHAALAPSRRAEVCFQNASAAADQGLHDAAIAQYLRVREIDPTFPGVAHRLALIYDRQGDCDRASEEYARALAAAPRDADLWNDFGYFEYERQRLAESERALRRALEIAPDHPRATINLGLVFAEQGRYQEALELHARIVGPAAARSNLGVILARHGEDAAAQQAFAEALSQDPSLEAPRLVQSAIRPPAVVATADGSHSRR